MNNFTPPDFSHQFPHSPNSAKNLFRRCLSACLDLVSIFLLFILQMFFVVVELRRISWYESLKTFFHLQDSSGNCESCEWILSPTVFSCHRGVSLEDISLLTFAFGMRYRQGKWVEGIWKDASLMREMFWDVCGSFGGKMHLMEWEECHWGCN